MVGGDHRLSTVLFPEKPFNDLGELLSEFSKVEPAEYGDGDTPEAEGLGSSTAEREGGPVWHIANVIARFRGLVEVRTRMAWYGTHNLLFLFECPVLMPHRSSALIPGAWSDLCLRLC